MILQIIALVLGILLLLVSFLELLGEIKKKRLLQALDEVGELPILLPGTDSHFTDVQHLKSRDLIDVFESCSNEQKTSLLQYLQKQQLAEMDRTRLSGIWWLIISLFRHAYTSAEHRHPRPAKEKLVNSQSPY
jgi:hypothetical protein